MPTLSAAAIMVAALASTVSAQAAPADVLSHLLDEVRALRIAMQQSATAGARIQLLTARLSIQESRVARLARDLEDARINLVRLADSQQRAADMHENLEAMLPVESDPGRRRQLEAELRSIKQQIEMQSSEEQFLRNRESALEASYDAEQARWLEISNRLDELERSLERP
jgi:hypothetical protein